MFMQLQHQSSARAPARRSADSRPSGIPAYYLGRPASLWISVTNSAPLARRSARDLPRPS